MVVALVCATAWATLSVSNFDAAIGAENDKDVVVVLHGLGRSKMAMWLLASRLEDAGYKVARVGYRSLQDTPKQIIADIEGQRLSPDSS
jgi:ABC-type proline/glycine betaine transport system substrate-binding protein